VIEAHLLGHGYKAMSGESLNRELALFPKGLLAFIQETQQKPDRISQTGVSASLADTPTAS
jgi:hypothetical protein